MKNWRAREAATSVICSRWIFRSGDGQWLAGLTVPTPGDNWKPNAGSPGEFADIFAKGDRPVHSGQRRYKPLLCYARALYPVCKAGRPRVLPALPCRWAKDGGPGRLGKSRADRAFSGLAHIGGHGSTRYRPPPSLFRCDFTVFLEALWKRVLQKIVLSSLGAGAAGNGDFSSAFLKRIRFLRDALGKLGAISFSIGGLMFLKTAPPTPPGPPRARPQQFRNRLREEKETAIFPPHFSKHGWKVFGGVREWNAFLERMLFGQSRLHGNPGDPWDVRCRNPGGQGGLRVGERGAARLI